MTFEIIGKIVDIEVIAAGPSVRQRRRLKRLFGPGRWRKLKGSALVRVETGFVQRVELHW